MLLLQKDDLFFLTTSSNKPKVPWKHESLPIEPATVPHLVQNFFSDKEVQHFLLQLLSSPYNKILL